MPIVFEKRLTQNYLGSICETKRQATINHKYNFKDYVLTEDDCIALRPMAVKDATGFYFNALLSFVQGCNSLLAGSLSWACVELYYSLFYATRAHLYYKNYLLIRDRGLYLVKIESGVHPETKNNKEYNTDHKGTLNYFIDKFKESDYLCSNNIDTDNVYRWMEDLRETTNYRNKCFCEPDCFAELLELYTRIKNKGLSSVLLEFKSDFDTFCFSENYSWLCAPYYKLLEVAAYYKSCGEQWDEEKKQYVKDELKRIGITEDELIQMV